MSLSSIYHRWRNRLATYRERLEFNGSGRRQYADYDQYLDHQVSKLNGHEVEFANRFERRTEKFRKRFATLKKDLDFQGPVLCLGARLGEEVLAFRNCGFTATGVDLNPGVGNPYVIKGDFHDLPFAANEFATAYSNVLDHVLDLDVFLEEAQRVTSGHIIFDITGGYEETGRIDPYGALIWPTNEELLKRINAVLGEPVYNVAHSPTHRCVAWKRPITKQEGRAS